MRKRRTSTVVLAITAATGLLLSACAPQAGTPVVQTVEVRVTEIVEKQVEVEKIVEVTATPVPEWTRPHPILSDKRVRQAIAHCTNPIELIGSVYGFLPEEQRAKQVMDTPIPKDSQIGRAHV